MIRAARSLTLAPRIFSRRIANTPPPNPVQSQSHLSSSQSLPIIAKLHFFNSVTASGAQIPTYRVIDGSGKLIDGAELPDVRFTGRRVDLLSYNCRLTKHLHGECERIVFCKAGINVNLLRYENMLLCPTLDNILNNVQRQGKISFYVCLYAFHNICPCIYVSSR